MGYSEPEYYRPLFLPDPISHVIQLTNIIPPRQSPRHIIYAFHMEHNLHPSHFHHQHLSLISWSLFPSKSPLVLISSLTDSGRRESAGRSDRLLAFSSLFWLHILIPLTYRSAAPFTLFYLPNVAHVCTFALSTYLY